MYDPPDLSQAKLNSTDLIGANFSGANLTGADLSGADLSRARLIRTDLGSANLSGANLIRTDLGGADLVGTNLSGANLNGAYLSRADLSGANLSEAKLTNADLSEAKLINADLSRAKLIDADLSRTNLSEANLSRANLSMAILSGADLSMANLSKAYLYQVHLYAARLKGAYLYETNLQTANIQQTIFDGANLTGAQLWETQRAGWSIKGVICERAYWDQKAEIPTEYEPGEFERLYSEQTTIELHYPGGLSTFELSTLPALLHHLSQKHEGVVISLRGVEQTGGGAKVTISLGDVDEPTKEKIEADAIQVKQSQLALRESEGRRLQLQDDYNRMLEHMTKTLLAAASSQVHFHGSVHTAALPSGNATVQLNQTFNDNTELIQLIDKLLIRNVELTQSQSAEIEAAKAELQKPNPDKSLLTRTLGFLKTLPKEAVLKGAGKLGEKAVDADWSSLLHQLSAFISHLR